MKKFSLFCLIKVNDCLIEINKLVNLFISNFSIRDVQVFSENVALIEEKCCDNRRKVLC